MPQGDRPTPPGSGGRALLDEWESPLGSRLASRVVMSAMTRSAAGPAHVPTEAMATYYARRARHGVGLILTESTAVAAVGDGFPDAPRIITPSQVEGWRTVTSAVQAVGGTIFCQLIHCGRMAHPDYTGGLQPVSSTDRPAAGIIRRNGKPYVAPRRLAVEELPTIVDEFGAAAEASCDAGFDGVELHLAHGYLIDQFLDARVNDRDDEYGGSIVNRCRLALELTQAVIARVGPSRVIARLSPSRWMGGHYEWPDMPAMLDYLIPALDAAGLRALDISCARADYFTTSGSVVRAIRRHWPHLLIAGASLTESEAQAELDARWLDMVTFGRALIANPDLVERWRGGQAVVPYNVRMLDELQ